MQNLDCSSLENSNVDFDQLSTLIEDVGDYLNGFRGNQGQIRVYSFEIPQQLLTPLGNLHHLFLALARNGRLTAAQKNILTICEKVLARFYCWIRYFMDLYIERCRVEPPVDESQQARHMAHEFYFYAMYELRTNLTVLMGYLHTPLLESESGPRTDFLSQVYSSALVPKNRDRVEKINYWMAELGKFIDNLPRLRDEFEDAA